MKSVALHNLGCKVNGYELDVIRQMLQEKGYNIVPFDEVADIYIVNTCTVTNIADRKSRQMLHKAKKRNPEAIVVAAGCYVQTGKEDVIKDAGIDLAVGNQKKKELVSLLEAYMEEREAASFDAETARTLGDTTVIDIGSVRDYESAKLERTAEHTRAYLKIQDGCNQFCSYCIIPYARGRVRSRQQDEIIEEVEALAANGYQEVVLTGIHISSYGVDFGERALLPLLERIHNVEGIRRIRLGSLEPGIVETEFVQALKAMPKVCPHFHLSLQSGCDETLKRMNRRYTTGEYSEKVALLREHYEEPAITTDVIVGFPGETEEEFAATCAFLEQLALYEMHIFKYSKRKGTPAALMEQQLTEAEKTARSNVLFEMERTHSAGFRERYIGKEVEILFEESKMIDGTLYQLGHTSRYVRAAVKSDTPFYNQLHTCMVKGFLTEDILLAESEYS